MSDTKKLTRDALVTKPPKWRNWWYTENGIDTQLNGVIPPRTTFPGAFTFNSRADAEAEAREDMAREVFYALAEGVKYLGAYPDGERP